MTPLATPISQLMHMWKEPQGAIKDAGAGNKRHAEDFGVMDATPKVEATTALANAVTTHVNDPNTLRIVGTYKKEPAILNFNPYSNLVVIQKPNGELVSGWSLFRNQVPDVLFLAELW